MQANQQTPVNDLNIYKVTCTLIQLLYYIHCYANHCFINL